MKQKGPRVGPLAGRVDPWRTRGGLVRLVRVMVPSPRLIKKRRRLILKVVPVVRTRPIFLSLARFVPWRKLKLLMLILTRKRRLLTLIMVKFTSVGVV